MNRIDRIFAELRASMRGGLMPFICAGRPTIEALPDVLKAVDGAGADIIEIGFPFSDPIADGPVIAAAMHRALESGVTTGMVMDAVRTARDEVSAGLVAMVSVSIVHRMGIERFAQRAAEAGFDGLIVPDAPVEEAAPIGEAAREAGLTMSLLVSPATTQRRAASIVAACSGFVYLLARVGITGERGETPEIRSQVESLRALTDLPIACGFGISSAEQVRAVTAQADAAIVGSALVRRIEEAAERGENGAAVAAEFVRELAKGVR